MNIGGGEIDQLALDITGSYRARFPVFAQDGPGASRNGMYIVNYHHLQGFRFDATCGWTPPGWSPCAQPTRNALYARMADIVKGHRPASISAGFRHQPLGLRRWCKRRRERIKWRDITQHDSPS
jgi:hypothetical protein